MNTRMDKYQIDDSSISLKQRTVKNKKLYEEVQNMNIDYIDIDVNDVIEITPDKKLKRNRHDYQMRREIEKIIPSEKEETVLEKTTPKEERIYDINEILRLARNNKLFDDNKKRLINTEYNILTKLDIEQINQTEDISKEGLRKLIDEIYQNEENTVEKSMLDDDGKKPNDSCDDGLLSDLIDDDLKDEIVIDEDISKDILDKTDIKVDNLEIKQALKENTNSVVKLTDNIDDTSDEVILEEVRKSKTLLVVTIVIVLVLFGVGTYLYYNFFGTI